MAEQEIMIDTSVLIDYFRKKDKEKTRLVEIFRNYPKVYISSITEFEIYQGAKQSHIQFWDAMLTRIAVLDFDSRCVRKAADVVADLKKKRKSLDKPDLFIPATALVNNLILDTFNIKHFDKVEGLKLMTEP